MVEHVVLLKFGEQTTREQKDELIRRAQNLKGHIPGIADLKINYNLSSRSQGYEIIMIVSFDEQQALDAYGPHPEHQKVVAYMNEIGARPPLVVDFLHD